MDNQITIVDTPSRAAKELVTSTHEHRVTIDEKVVYITITIRYDNGRRMPIEGCYHVDTPFGASPNNATTANSSEFPFMRKCMEAVETKILLWLNLDVGL